ncbi:ammonium transporter [Methanohalobium evestigatum Z-7303]|uniref:Ammonium transporter n=1 Tax=Methanohalobium evestigatum (strain ATCC BAA-1072 / DSM 3721 / NBRC 107634 / OCM 161 / Z-7303) TaxID=644295 RepID=D7E934_METEZ|nr:ammonium transporter [Methanohalobium evestigatum]ADI73982.1 ammonium transporter [Methanohalobium evestigatum Z-7303]
MYRISIKSKRITLVIATLILVLLTLTNSAYATSIEENAASITSLETTLTFVWLILSGAIVFLMHAGFSLVEAGLTRSKNTANILMKNFMTISLGVLVYWAVGWAIMYGTDAAGLVGTSQFFLSGADNSLWNSWWFQMVFAATAATIVSGAVAERMEFKAYLIYAILMVALIYPVYGHWVWSGSELALLTGADSFIVNAIGTSLHDFAGSSVVHAVGGYAALAAVIILGPRIGKFRDGEPVAIPGHNLAYAFLGTLILAFGWIGFNGGSTLDATDAYMNLVIVNTFIAAAAGAVSAMLVTWVKTGKPDPSLTANGLLAGLVAITAPCGSVENWAALIIGTIGGIIVYAGVMFNENVLKVDDPVGAISVHGYSGSWGLLSVGIFSVGLGNGILEDAVYAASVPGLIYGGVSQFLIQLVGVIVNIIWAFGASFFIFKIIDVIIGTRVSEEDEITGLDTVEHGIEAYPEHFTTESE